MRTAPPLLAFVLFSSLLPGSAGALRLVGITGDGADTPETLYEISTTDASTTFLMTLGNGDNGEGVS